MEATRVLSSNPGPYSSIALSTTTRTRDPVTFICLGLQMSPVRSTTTSHESTAPRKWNVTGVRSNRGIGRGCFMRPGKVEIAFMSVFGRRSTQTDSELAIQGIAWLKSKQRKSCLPLMWTSCKGHASCCVPGVFKTPRLTIYLLYFSGTYVPRAADTILSLWGYSQLSKFALLFFNCLTILFVGALFKTPAMFHNGVENSWEFQGSSTEYTSTFMGPDNSNINWLILTLTQAVELSKNDIWKNIRI